MGVTSPPAPPLGDCAETLVVGGAVVLVAQPPGADARLGDLGVALDGLGVLALGGGVGCEGAQASGG
eukprot:3975598-Alexandrium_andersonii.AAC.1